MWLRADYPKEFNLMLDSKKIRKKSHAKTLGRSGVSHRPLVAPDGTVYHHIENIADFCRNHPELKNKCSSTRSSIGKVLKGRKKSHLGWKLLE